APLCEYLFSQSGSFGVPRGAPALLCEYLFSQSGSFGVPRGASAPLCEYLFSQFQGLKPSKVQSHGRATLYHLNDGTQPKAAISPHQLPCPYGPVPGKLLPANAKRRSLITISAPAKCISGLRFLF